MTKNPKIKRWFDRIEDEEYLKEYIHGIIALYEYGEVSMNNFLKYLNIQHRVVEFVLAAHGICIYNNHSNTSKKSVDVDLQKLIAKIENNFTSINVTKETINEIKSFYTIKSKNKKNKNSEGETEEEGNSDNEHDSEELDEDAHQFQTTQPTNLFQTPEDQDDDYWEKWNESTM
uniref:Uncharacterized protein n=1 Tax=Meloidogyne enterolobii TaxID=390850 RepID=A0A6V7TLW4_MELEN|nr:unnamed protein product [Meloidogyne enterolobii]